MKILTPILALSTIFFTSCNSKNVDSSIIVVGDTLLQERVIETFFEENKINLIASTDNIAEKLKSNREFILTYFVEGATSSPKIKNIISEYGSLTNLDYIKISKESGEVIATYGASPSRVLKGETISVTGKKNNIYQFENITNRLIDFKREKIEITTARYIKRDNLIELSKLLKKELLFFNNDKMFLSTFDKIESLNKKDNSVMIIDGVEYQTRRISINNVDIMVAEKINKKEVVK